MGQQDGQLAGDPGPSRPIYQDFKANLWDSTSEFGGDLSAVLVNIDSRCHADCCYLDVLQAPNQPFLAFWDATVLLLLLLSYPTPTPTLTPSPVLVPAPTIHRARGAAGA